jgi:CheY-like chemotaxis protein
MPIRVLIVVVGEIADGDELIEAVTGLAPDVLLLDIVMPRLGAVEHVRQVADLAGGPRVLMLTNHDGAQRRVIANALDGLRQRRRVALGKDQAGPRRAPRGSRPSSTQPPARRGPSSRPALGRTARPSAVC